MKLLFSFVFLFFLSFSTQAILLTDYYNNSSNRDEFDWDAFPKKNLLQRHIGYINHRINHFDWEAFANKENVQKYIDYRNQKFNNHGIGIPVGVKLDKIYLVRIEQELELYKMGIKTGLSPELIQATKEAIALHWKNLNSKESQAKAYTGLEGFIDVSIMKPKRGTKRDYYEGIWELYRADYEIALSMVEKGDKGLYKTLGSNDEFYVKFITPYVKRFLKKIQNTAQAYYNSLAGELDYKTLRNTYYAYLKVPYYIKGSFKDINIINLNEMYFNSLKIKNSFFENFKTPIGKHQKELIKDIESWHTNQAFLGVDGWIDSYNYQINTSPSTVAARLRKFYEAPMEVKKYIALFLRNILNNEKLMHTNDDYFIRGRSHALIGLYVLGLTTDDEEELYNEAIEQGIISHHNFSAHAYSVDFLPLPDVTKKSEEQKVTEERHTHSGSDLSLLDVSS